MFNPTRRRARFTLATLALGASLGLMLGVGSAQAESIAQVPLAVGPAPASVAPSVPQIVLGDATSSHNYTVAVASTGRYTVRFTSPEGGNFNATIDDTSGFVPAACWASAEKLVGSTNPAPGVCPILQQTQVPYQSSAYSQTFALAAGRHTISVSTPFAFGPATATLVGPLT